MFSSVPSFLRRSLLHREQRVSCGSEVGAHSSPGRSVSVISGGNGWASPGAEGSSDGVSSPDSPILSIIFIILTCVHLYLCFHGSGVSLVSPVCAVYVRGRFMNKVWFDFDHYVQMFQNLHKNKATEIYCNVVVAFYKRRRTGQGAIGCQFNSHFVCTQY